MPDFVVKEAPDRANYPSGMNRGSQKGKPNYNLIDKEFLKRIAEHLTKGAEIYGRDNWRMANSEEELQRFEDSAHRHLMQYLNRELDEDHAAATVFNLMCAEYVRTKLEEENESLKWFANLLEEHLDARFDSHVIFTVFVKKNVIQIEFRWLEGAEEHQYIRVLTENQAIYMSENVEAINSFVKSVRDHIYANRDDELYMAYLMIRSAVRNYFDEHRYEVTVDYDNVLGVKVNVRWYSVDVNNCRKLGIEYWIGNIDAKATAKASDLLKYHLREISRRIDQANPPTTW